jgi:hypothetical protein
MYFDVVIVEVEKYLLFFILALAILWEVNFKFSAKEIIAGDLTN